jgi:hypothetical protein
MVLPSSISSNFVPELTSIHFSSGISTDCISYVRGRIEIAAYMQSLDEV